MYVGGVNYRTSGKLKVDKFGDQITTASIIWGQTVFFIVTLNRYTL